MIDQMVEVNDLLFGPEAAALPPGGPDAHHIVTRGYDHDFAAHLHLTNYATWGERLQPDIIRQ
jgi:hypothetical protein